jgi:hypothetical protein
MISQDSLKVNLKVIGQIPENCKISHNGNDITFSLVKGRYLQGVSRYFNGDSRDKTITLLTCIIETAILASKNILDSKMFYRGKIDLSDSFVNDKMSRETKCVFLDLQNLSQGLKESISGLKNLKKTYNKDTTFGCRIEILITRITDHCSVTQKLIGIPENIL